MPVLDAAFALENGGGVALDLKGKGVSRVDPSLARGCPNLGKLDLGDNVVSDRASIAAIAECEQLKWLSLANCGLGGAGLAPCAEGQAREVGGGVVITFEPTEGVLVVLSGVIITLFAVTLIFSAYAIVLRFRHARRDRLWTALTNMWEEPVLAAIVDPERVDDVHEEVPEEYRLHFVNFILEYTRRVRGEERQTLVCKGNQRHHVTRFIEP